MDKIFKNEDGNEASQSNSTADGGSSSSNQNLQPSVIDDRVMGDFSSEARFFKVSFFLRIYHGQYQSPSIPFFSIPIRY